MSNTNVTENSIIYNINSLNQSNYIVNATCENNLYNISELSKPSYNVIVSENPNIVYVNTDASKDISNHINQTTQAHGGLVASNDFRLTNTRNPNTHGNEAHTLPYLTLDDISVLNILDITYEDLLTIVQNNELIIDKKYRIINFKTYHIIPYTNPPILNIGPDEPLIVTAIATNALDIVAYSEEFPQDIIHYELINTSVNESDAINSNFIYGRIIYREDTIQNISMYEDFRGVKYTRSAATPRVVTLDIIGGTLDVDYFYEVDEIFNHRDSEVRFYINADNTYLLSLGNSGFEEIRPLHTEFQEVFDGVRIRFASTTTDAMEGYGAKIWIKHDLDYPFESIPSYGNMITYPIENVRDFNTITGGKPSLIKVGPNLKGALSNVTIGNGDVYHNTTPVVDIVLDMYVVDSSIWDCSNVYIGSTNGSILLRRGSHHIYIQKCIDNTTLDNCAGVFTVGRISGTNCTNISSIGRGGMVTLGNNCNNLTVVTAADITIPENTYGGVHGVNGGVATVDVTSYGLSINATKFAANYAQYLLIRTPGDIIQVEVNEQENNELGWYIESFTGDWVWVSKDRHCNISNTSFKIGQDGASIYTVFGNVLFPSDLLQIPGADQNQSICKVEFDINQALYSIGDTITIIADGYPLFISVGNSNMTRQNLAENLGFGLGSGWRVINKQPYVWTKVEADGWTLTSPDIYLYAESNYSGWGNQIQANLKGVLQRYTFSELEYNKMSNIINNDIQEAQLKHGFENNVDSNLTYYSYDLTSNKFTLYHINDFTVYINGVSNIFNTNLELDFNTLLTWTNTSADYGQWFIWLNQNGVLDASKIPWDILDTTLVPVATVYWDGVAGYVGEERHFAGRNLLYHKQAHNTWGSQYVSGFTSTPTFGSSANNNFSFVGGVIADEDIQNNTILLDTNYIVQNNQHSTMQLGYRTNNNNSMLFNTRSTTYAKLNTLTPVYDNNSILTNITNGNYGVTWIFATNRIGCPIIGILGQAQYTSVANAQAAAMPILAGMSVAEWKLLYLVIYRNVGGSLLFNRVDTKYNISSGPAIIQATPTNIAATNVTVNTFNSNIVDNVQTSLENLETNKLDVYPTSLKYLPDYLIYNTTTGAWDTILPTYTNYSTNKDPSNTIIQGGIIRNIDISSGFEMQGSISTNQNALNITQRTINTSNTSFLGYRGVSVNAYRSNILDTSTYNNNFNIGGSFFAGHLQQPLDTIISSQSYGISAGSINYSGYINHMYGIRNISYLGAVSNARTSSATDFIGLSSGLRVGHASNPNLSTANYCCVINAEASQLNNGARLTDHYGIRVVAPILTGDATISGIRRGISQEGISEPNLFQGKTMVGGTGTPVTNAQLEVTGDISATTHILIGDNTPSGDDSALLICRDVTGNGLFSHAVRDESSFNSGPLDSAYASFDAIPHIIGTQAYNHIASFQARPNISSTGKTGAVWGHTFQGYGSGNIGNMYGFYMTDYAGTGVVDMQVGLFFPALTKGVSNFAIYSSDSNTPSYHGGKWSVGSGGIETTGTISASNCLTDAVANTVRLGVGQQVLTPYYVTAIGHAVAPNSLGNDNTLIGALVGNALTSQTGNVFVGKGAGYYETNSNRLIIDNSLRAGDHSQNSLIYGEFNTDPNAQRLTVNGSLWVNTPGTRPTASVSMRGRLWTTFGGAGVADKISICVKNASDAYVWVDL